jgi:DNA primase
LIEHLRIGYAPGACLRAHLLRQGYPRQALLNCGLIDCCGRDRFFRSLTFPLPEAHNLYGRSLVSDAFRHHFLPGGKGGLYGWAQAQSFSSVILVEGLFDLAALWQAGFPQAVAALGSHPNATQMAQLQHPALRRVYVCFDADHNGSGQRAALALAGRLRHNGVEALRVSLPCGSDPASWFAAGGSHADFQRYLEGARP